MKTRMMAAGLLAGWALVAHAIPEGPEPNTPEWFAREAQNYAHVTEAPLEILNLDFQLQWQQRSLSNHNEWLARALNDPSWLGLPSGNTAVTPVAATWGAVATGDPTIYPQSEGPNGRPFYENEVEIAPVVFYDAGCARISGRIWAPKGWQAGDASLPGVIIQNGSIQASETLYWWMAQPLVRAGYVVMTFDPRGQGRSDWQTPSGQPGGNIHIAVFTDGLVDAVDFFRSTPVAPYPHNETCKDSYPTVVTAFNPFHDRIDRQRLGAAGHSAGASGVSIVQGYPGERFAFPDDETGANPIDVIVAWDKLEFDEENPPRVPAMGQTSEYLVAAPPHVTPPDPEGDKGAYSGWITAQLPAYQLTVAGSTHFDWSLLPGFPASSWCPDISSGSCEGGWGRPMIVHYSLAWLDRWLKKSGEPGFEDADARLLDDAPWCERYSFYSRSARHFPMRGGKTAESEDIRAECVAATATPPADKAARYGGAFNALLLLIPLLLRRRRTLLAASAALLLSACSPGSDGINGPQSRAETNPYADYVSTSYSGVSNWLCHPHMEASSNLCATANLETTFVEADGSASVENFAPTADAPVDCFYVYPTTSLDPGANSDFNPGTQENQTTVMQAARYGSLCKMYAPVYRQRTLTQLALDSVADPLITDEAAREAFEKAYADVLDAFREYMAHHNNGRGVILIGHSQGSRIIARLLAEEIEQQPYALDKLIAAHIPGTLVEVPVGADVGGLLHQIPACRSPDQTGCVIPYASYREGDPQLSDPRFGVTGTPGMQALCVNPAALAGGTGPLEPYLPFILPPAFQVLLIPRGIGAGPYDSPLRNAQTELQTPFFSVPGQLSAQCKVNEIGASYLEVHIDADPADPRADDYPGEFFGGTGWGLHLADVNLAQGNLIALARSQSAAWLQRH